jgi:hypothetical protein
MVSALDAASQPVCNGVTDPNGTFSCIIDGARYAATNGSYTITTMGSVSFTIAASGCRTNAYQVSVRAPTTETRALSGC